jgi:hypothetical protein
LPNGEKAFHVIEVQSDWGQKLREEQARFGEHVKAGKLVDTDMSRAGYLTTQQHPLLEHYETLGLKAAIQHAKEIGATKVILPDAETAMMTEGHDKGGNVEAVPVKGATPEKVSGPRQYNFDTKLPDGWEWNHDFRAVGRLATDPNGNLFALHEVRAYEDPASITADNIQYKSPGSGVLQAETWAVPVEGKISQEKGMRLHYDQTLPSAMRKLTGDKGTPVDLGEHKNALATQDEQNLQGRMDGSPVFKDAAGKPKTSITGKIYDISKTPDQFKLMKAGDKFAAAKYLAA